MKTLLKRVVLSLLALVGVVVVLAVALAFLPSPLQVRHQGITPDEAAARRARFAGPHQTFTTTDGDTLFLRRWDPDSLPADTHDLAVLILHGITAHSGAYDMAGVPFAAGGYTTFGLDYRGHGLSSGNRGDSPSKDRWVADLVEAVRALEALGFPRVVVLGHSLGVAAAMSVADAIPRELAGVVLLSGAYDRRPEATAAPPSRFQQARILASAVVRPSHQVVEYYRDGMLGLDDPLFSYAYTVRFLTMLDVQELRLPDALEVPVLVGVGDQDELFSVQHVRDLYDRIPGTTKEFLVLQGATHAELSRAHWEAIVAWLDRRVRGR